jgi:hypothetical protein
MKIITFRLVAKTALFRIGFFPTVFLSLVVLGGCEGIVESNHFTASNRPQTNRTPDLSSCQTSEAALLVAWVKIASDYDVSKLDSNVTEKEEAWIIDFRPKREYEKWTGGTPSVKVNKQNCEIVSFYFGK